MWNTRPSQAFFGAILITRRRTVLSGKYMKKGVVEIFLRPLSPDFYDFYSF